MMQLDESFDVSASSCRITTSESVCCALVCIFCLSLKNLVPNILWRKSKKSATVQKEYKTALTFVKFKAVSLEEEKYKG